MKNTDFTDHSCTLLETLRLGFLMSKPLGQEPLWLKMKVLLIKHTYQSGWYTIGGGVKKHESPRKAIVRELLEEVGVTPLEEPDLFAVPYHEGSAK